MVALDGRSESQQQQAMADISSVTELVTTDHHGVRAAPPTEKKMTYNEWRQIRKRRKMLYKGKHYNEYSDDQFQGFARKGV